MIKPAALFIVALASASYAAGSPSTQPAAESLFPTDLFQLSLQPQFPAQPSQPSMPVFVHAVKQTYIDLRPPQLHDPHDGMLLPSASHQPPVDLIDDRR